METTEELEMTEAKSDREAIADRLRLARERAGLSQGQVAKLLGVHRPAVTEIEAARRKVSAEELAQLAEVYRVSISWLARGDSDLDGDVENEIRLAARDLAELKPEDLNAVITLLRTLKQSESKTK